MPKHRSPGFAVVRECSTPTNTHPFWYFDGIIGMYLSLARAEEVAAATVQKYTDMGMDPDNPEYRCLISPTNWYDE